LQQNPRLGASSPSTERGRNGEIEREEWREREGGMERERGRNGERERKEWREREGERDRERERAKEGERTCLHIDLEVCTHSVCLSPCLSLLLWAAVSSAR